VKAGPASPHGRTTAAEFAIFAKAELGLEFSTSGDGRNQPQTPDEVKR